MVIRSRLPQMQDQVEMLLHMAGVRPTRQRLTIAKWLFDGHHKHITAEQVFAAMSRNHSHIALATVYNCLHQFTSAGLLQRVPLDGGQIYFDTNMEHHHHFLDDATGELSDIPANAVRITRLPEAPPGKTVSVVSVIVRLRCNT